MRTVSVQIKLLLLACFLAPVIFGERVLLHDARYPITGCQSGGVNVPNVIGLFDVIATPNSLLLQWLDPHRMLQGAGPCARVNGNTAYPSETHELKLSMASPWNTYYAVDLVDGSYSNATEGSNNRTYGQHSVQISPGNEEYAIALSRISSYDGWPNVYFNGTQTTYLMMFMELEWNGELIPGVISHQDTAKNALFDCTGHPSPVFEHQTDRLRPMYCPLGVNQTYYPRIRFDHPPTTEIVIEVPVPVPVPAPVPVPMPVPVPAQDGSPASNTSCPVCEDPPAPEDPVDCAKRIQDGGTLFMAGLQSEDPAVAAVFVVAVVGCVTALLLLIMVGVLLILYVRNRRSPFRQPGLNVGEDYLVQLSEGSSQVMDVRNRNQKMYRDDGTESSTPRPKSEADTTDTEVIVKEEKEEKSPK